MNNVICLLATLAASVALAGPFCPADPMVPPVGKNLRSAPLGYSCGGRSTRGDPVELANRNTLEVVADVTLQSTVGSFDLRRTYFPASNWWAYYFDLIGIGTNAAPTPFGAAAADLGNPHFWNSLFTFYNPGYSTLLDPQGLIVEIAPPLLGRTQPEIQLPMVTRVT